MKNSINYTALINTSDLKKMSKLLDFAIIDPLIYENRRDNQLLVFK
ncbi:MAG: hypothetical protein ABIF85_05815 [Nanoarchaeota archaeon]|nr:hypothetical protein [Nanoarchaeota archaeon]MBU4451649.1 hypothetical protein [Nanoarchaeota archaeon]MCG2723636.1 hypothetical protein [archaeon]